VSVRGCLPRNIQLFTRRSRSLAIGWSDFGTTKIFPKKPLMAVSIIVSGGADEEIRRNFVTFRHSAAITLVRALFSDS